MTVAWYAHLKNLSGKAWYVAAAISWSIAFFEYMFQVPANRIGYTALSLPQLKIMQEVITLTVFVPFVIFYMKQPIKLDRSEEHTSELQSLMRISYAVFCLKKKKKKHNNHTQHPHRTHKSDN